MFETITTFFEAHSMAASIGIFLIAYCFIATEKIEKLSCYISSTGKKYKNHYATILNWARNSKKQVKLTEKDSPKKYFN